MRPNPWDDLAGFVSTASGLTVVFWLLLLGSLGVSVAAWRADPGQRGAGRIGVWLLRVILGGMWWQQSLWKVPPDESGLVYWMQQMVDHAAVPLQGRLVRDVVLPHIAVFEPLVYGVEVLIGVSLMLGLLTRLGGVLGLLMALNLWLGLYSAPGEWPWTYGFLVLLQARAVIDPPGRCLGIDALLRRRGRLPAALG